MGKRKTSLYHSQRCEHEKDHHVNITHIHAAPTTDALQGIPAFLSEKRHGTKMQERQHG